jgi:hypothetical protein
VPKLRKGFWFYFPVALLAWLAPVTSVRADALGEWTYSQSQNCGGYIEVSGSGITLHGPDNQLAPQGSPCGGAHWVKIETTIPADVDTIDFTWSYQTNDGWVYDPPQYGINGVYTLLTQQNNATGTKSVPVNEGDIFTFRQYSIDTCCQPGHLTISNLSLWNGISQTTTTSSTTTTTSSTTTSSTTTSSSVPQTTSTESSTTTTLPLETSTSTTEPQTTTTSSTSTTVPEPSTTTTEMPVNTTTTTTSSTTTSVPQIVVEVPTGTTTTVVEEPYIEETPLEETTTTTEPEPETTTTETYPDTTVEETTTTTILEEIIPEEIIIEEEEVAAVIEELADITEITPEVLSEVVDALNSDNISEEQVQAIVDAVVENLDTLTEITAEVLDKVLNILESDSISEKQVQDIVDTILATDVSSDQATQLATSAAVLENVTADQATEIFATVDTGELTEEQSAAIVEAVQNAPTEVKEAFEEEINVFEGGFDDYIPTDSVISVGARRVVVAATTVSFILPAPIVSSRRR